MAGIYKHSHFTADIFGHGGNKRTAQINALLNDAGIIFEEIDFLKYERPGKDIPSLLKGTMKAGPKGLIKNYAIGRALNKFEDFIKDRRPDLFIWESTVDYNLLLAELLHKYNVPFIALPHNLESLVKPNLSKKPNNWLKEEINSFKNARHTFTISREENWLLNLNGVTSSYLPYYPPEALEKHLLNIRKRKENYLNKDNGISILILGTFYNTPTINGYKEVLKYLSMDPEIQINVVGFGSEQLLDQFSSQNIKIWGSVNDEKLSEMIITNTWAVIHQEPTSGALTRIQELLISGIPILANVHAARSYQGTPGLDVYNDLSELTYMLKNLPVNIPPILKRPDAEGYFKAFLKQL